MSQLLSSLSGIFSQFSTTTSNSSAGAGHLQEDFIPLNAFYNGYRECKSNHEASTFVANHAKHLKWQLSSTHLSNVQICVILERCLVCKSLGQDVSFAGIYAIQLAQSSQQWCHKLTAYIACSLLVDESSDMSILMVSTLQRDLRSRHVPSVCVALSTAATIISSELIPSIDAIVCEKMKHSSAVVRRKAVACLGAFIRRQPTLIESKLSYLKATLLDKDPGTMAMTLQVLGSLPHSYLKSSEDLFKPLLCIVNQFVCENVPRNFMRNGVCGPQVLTASIRLLGKLCQELVDWKQKVQLSVLSVMDKYETSTSLSAVMVVGECCLELPRLSADNKHLGRVTHYAGQLLKSKLANYNSVGLKILTELIQYDRALITSNQGVILSALNSSDPVIADKSMSLIIQLTTPTNIQSVFELYKKISGSQKNESKLSQNHGLKIVTSCLLSKINIEWFSQRIIEIFTLETTVDPNVSSHAQNCSSTSTLNTVLTYLSGEDVTEPSLALYNHLKDALSKMERPFLDILTIMLWLITLHKNRFPECDSECVELVMSTCSSQVNSSTTILTFLTAIRNLIICRKLTLKSSDLDVIKEMASRVNAGDTCKTYLKDIDNAMSTQSESECTESVTLTDSFWTALESYAQRKLDSGSCRSYSVQSRSSSSDRAALKFSPDREASVMITSGEVQLRRAKTVWTAKGRVDNDEEGDRSGRQNSVPHDETAPVEFDVVEGETTTDQLAAQIFSG